MIAPVRYASVRSCFDELCYPRIANVFRLIPVTKMGTYFTEKQPSFSKRVLGGIKYPQSRAPVPPRTVPLSPFGNHRPNKSRSRFHRTHGPLIAILRLELRRCAAGR